MKRAPSFRLPRHVATSLAHLGSAPADTWEHRGERAVLALFRFMVRTVPAYRAFLNQHNCDPKKIRTITDFKNLPISGKPTYLTAFPYADLFPYKNLASITTYSATSGSTGEPFYFPRNADQDAQYAYVAECFFRNQFSIARQRTLCVLGFGLGIWIGGLFTYAMLQRLAARGLNLSVIPTGPDKKLFLQSIKRFTPYYDQVILMGYPPFLKDIVDDAHDMNIPWSTMDVKIMTATEPFSEDFRSYIARAVHMQNPLTDFVNIYGTVEFGTMAHETALSNLIRRFAVADDRIFRAVFGDATRLPTLTQYHPQIVYFEEVDGELIASGYGSAIPLIRHKFPDRGGVIPYADMVRRLARLGIDIHAQARRAGIEETIMRLPFVYVYERSDFATTLVGINIYPEYVRAALDHAALSDAVTGKCTIVTRTTDAQDQYLAVHIEMKKGVQQTDAIKKDAERHIVESFMKKSTEYRYLYEQGTAKDKAKLRPHIVFWPYGDSTYFSGKGKQQWAIRKHI